MMVVNRLSNLRKQGFVVFNTQVEFDNADTMFIYGSDILNDITSQLMVDGRIWVLKWT